ncbi:hypothetical protein GOODEAATRI_004511 [Goodea atripinnis]|uniref:Uncharacterized protein n=1 Tax=Goodea atripinnis TaxID=208336 RepID=A0ABV0NHG3_9TELE
MISTRLLTRLSPQLSMSLVRVPLDTEDTLSCYREALGKRPHCLLVLQHSRSLLVQLLAGTQPYSEESGGNMESREVDIEHKEQEMLETEGSSPKAEKPKVVTLCNTKEKLSPERIKVLEVFRLPFLVFRDSILC